MPINALVWGENVHERENAIVANIYPDGMHSTIAAALAEDEAITAEVEGIFERAMAVPAAAPDEVYRHVFADESPTLARQRQWNQPG